MDILNYIYWICFGVGTGYVLVAGIMGMAGGFDTDSGDVGLDSHDFHIEAHGMDAHGIEIEVDSEADLDFDHELEIEAHELEHGQAAHVHGPGEHHDHGDNLGQAAAHSPDLASFNPFSLVSIMSFLAAFGGGGLLSGKYGAGLAISLLAALLAGTAMAVFFWLVVGKWLFSMQGTSHARQADMIGMEADVITPLAHDKTGEIAYVIRGTRFTAPARLSEEGEVGRNEKVRIRVKRDNTYYVERRRSLLE